MSNRPRTGGIEWRGNPPQPFPVDYELVTKENMVDAHWAALSLPYVGKKKMIKYENEEGGMSFRESDEFLNAFEEACDGLRIIEVVARRKAQKAAEGDNEMIKYLEDRSLGKPTQHNQNINATMSWTQLAEYLGWMDDKEPLPPPPTQIPKLPNVNANYELVTDEDENFVDGEIIELSDEELLKNPIAGF